MQTRGADYAPHTTASPPPRIQKAIYTSAVCLYYATNLKSIHTPQYNTLLLIVIVTPVSLSSLYFQVYFRTLCYENKKNCENIMGNVCNVCKDRKVQVIK